MERVILSRFQYWIPYRQIGLAFQTKRRLSLNLGPQEQAQAQAMGQTNTSAMKYLMIYIYMYNYAHKISSVGISDMEQIYRNVSCMIPYIYDVASSCSFIFSICHR